MGRLLPLAALAACGVFLAYPLSTGGDQFTTTKPKPAPHTYLMRSSDGTGSCVPIARYQDFTIFVTARHMLEAGGPSQVRIGGVFHDVVRAESHPVLDIAILLVQVANIPTVEMSPEPTDYGDEVFGEGYPQGKQLALTHGYVSEPGLCSADIAWGMSGGAVYRDGKLVGIVSSLELAAGGFSSHALYFRHHFAQISDALPWILGMLPGRYEDRLPEWPATIR